MITSDEKHPDVTKHRMLSSNPKPKMRTVSTHAQPRQTDVKENYYNPFIDFNPHAPGEHD